MSNCKVIALTQSERRCRQDHHGGQSGVTLAKQGNKVLLIDADAQANLTMARLCQTRRYYPLRSPPLCRTSLTINLSMVFRVSCTTTRALTCFPSNIELSGFEVRLINAISRESVLKTCINEVKKNYDYVLIDCMPSLGMLTINALAAADSVVIPTQPHYLSAKGLELLLRSVSKVKRQINPQAADRRYLNDDGNATYQHFKEITATVKSAYGQRIKVLTRDTPFYPCSRSHRRGKKHFCL